MQHRVSWDGSINTCQIADISQIGNLKRCFLVVKTVMLLKDLRCGKMETSLYMVAKLHGFTMLYALRQVDWVLSSESIFKLYPFIIFTGLKLVIKSPIWQFSIQANPSLGSHTFQVMMDPLSLVNVYKSYVHTLSKKTHSIPLYY